MNDSLSVENIEKSLDLDAPPTDWPVLVQAMWWDRKGDWHRSHDIAQDEESSFGSLVHAYLHRKEGDLANAGYWYRRAGRALDTRSLDDEWEAIVTELVDTHS